MENKAEKKYKKMEEKIEKTNERISVCAGTGIALLAAAMAGCSWPLFVAAGAVGGVVGGGIHSTRKWLENRKGRKQK